MRIKNQCNFEGCKVLAPEFTIAIVERENWIMSSLWIINENHYKGKNIRAYRNTVLTVTMFPRWTPTAGMNNWLTDHKGNVKNIHVKVYICGSFYGYSNEINYMNNKYLN